MVGERRRSLDVQEVLVAVVVEGADGVARHAGPPRRAGSPRLAPPGHPPEVAGGAFNAAVAAAGATFAPGAPARWAHLHLGLAWDLVLAVLLVSVQGR